MCEYEYIQTRERRSASVPRAVFRDRLRFRRPLRCSRPAMRVVFIPYRLVPRHHRKCTFPSHTPTHDQHSGESNTFTCSPAKIIICTISFINRTIHGYTVHTTSQNTCSIFHESSKHVYVLCVCVFQSTRKS